MDKTNGDLELVGSMCESIGTVATVNPETEDDRWDERNFFFIEIAVVCK